MKFPRRIVYPLLFGLLVVSWGAVPTEAATTVQPLIHPDTVEMTVYRSGDLTLVEEHRTLRLQEGVNRLQFSWGDRRVDPSSPQLSFRGSEGFHLKETSYPTDDARSLIWTVEAERPVRTTAVVSYFQTGVTVTPRYDILVSNRSDTARLNARFRFTNRTGERLSPDRLNVLIGEVNLIESVAKIIRRWEKSAREEKTGSAQYESTGEQARPIRRKLEASRAAMRGQEDRTAESTRVSSDYHRMELDRGVILPAESTTGVPFLARASVGYSRRYEALIHDEAVSLHQTFRVPNTTANGLGTTVLPEGSVNVLKRSNRGAPSWRGETVLEYASPSDTAIIEVDRTPSVSVEKRTLSRSKKAFAFDDVGTLTGWRETRKEGVTLNNYRSDPLRIDVIRDFGRRYWSLLDASRSHRKPSEERLAFSLLLQPATTSNLTYTVRLPFGNRR